MFMCQKDSFLKEFNTNVVSCEPIVETGDKLLGGIIKDLGKDRKLYKILLEDTILFPEGGGQPDDHGLIGGKDVIRVIRDGTSAVHYVATAKDDEDLEKVLKPGVETSLRVDWNRRFDHMQQHSGQHLITGITDKLFGYPTTSWWLGTDESYLELDTKDITDEQIKTIETEVNVRIRSCAPVTVDVVELDDPKLQGGRAQNLPDDVKGNIRIVTITDVESNVCCGTHVTNLSQLQVIKLLNVVKKKGKCLLHFLCGNRVIERFSQQFEREQTLMGVLKTNPSNFVKNAEKLNISLKNVKKVCLTLSKDLAALEAKRLVANIPPNKLVTYHRDNVEAEFGTILLQELGSIKSYILLLTIKTEGSAGNLTLVGGEDVISKDKLEKLGAQLCEILDGKGSLRGNSFQAKVSKINGVNKAVKMAVEFMKEVQETQVVPDK